ncbi:hypothetical protein M407DRAFT_232085, partial [Tulasnella calospora MUT 4182]
HVPTSFWGCRSSPNRRLTPAVSSQHHHRRSIFQAHQARDRILRGQQRLPRDPHPRKARGTQLRLLPRKTLKHIEQVPKNAGMKKEDIDDAVLVGGSTRIPKVQSLLKEFFNGKKPSEGINPDDTVAWDAALHGGILPSDKGTDDVAP